ncbi:P-loop containing nucleoside triphosphate hydrolase protein [Polychytrium aggregatum]|uniref:P-loop containing nucleoside triphosphate hydrolase protein n=1 Tax=Polychytrium aggregatum TaxID=110093 RepID=UPI0022FEF122|nr:P-loop containing nucleoside triphosphate hydrolase protein [Polychytrium aggregatum]KAI9203491.1 P-loop containing nucleoside triphosphate hydrolase protein [Polychytrium aggregatum]
MAHPDLPSPLNSTDKITIALLGDAGVGKSSLAHMICNQQPLSAPSRTVGCSLHVKIHEHSRRKKTFFVELIDIGGSATRHRSSRHVFYRNGIDAVMLVHDCTNSKSFNNLAKWRADVFESLRSLESKKQRSLSSSGFELDVCVSTETSSLSSSTGDIPVLTVGTKIDLTEGTASRYRQMPHDGDLSVFVSTLSYESYSTVEPFFSSFFESIIDSKLHPLHERSHPLPHTQYQPRDAVYSNDSQRRRHIVPGEKAGYF